ncbi:hypothetical protein OsI_18081 [Oryza sativa Indica Group]|uniref:Uncharacterized protein n=1 Tax=Oryza sativa subsp. indica TaxID=39946 RepID=B8AWI9_ORYSI|nr:hypothetical protein OsI_18081 [Oryza sativa Indica Group]
MEISMEKNLEKRSRKRSRYLSPPYTFPFTTVTVQDDVSVSDSDQSEDLTNVAVADMLSALHAAALLDMDAANVHLLRRFFTLHKTTSPSSSSTRINTQAEFNPSSSRQKEEETTSKTKKKKKKEAAAAASTPTTTIRLPLTDVRNNLQKMISSLLGRSPTATATASHDHGAKLALAGEMRGLLAKVDKMLSATTPANRH